MARPHIRPGGMAAAAVWLAIAAVAGAEDRFQERILAGDCEGAAEMGLDGESAPEGETEEGEARRLAGVQNRQLFFGREHAAAREPELLALARHDSVRAWLAARATPTRAGFEAVVAAHPGFRPARRSLATALADEGEQEASDRLFQDLLSGGPPDDWESPHRFAFACYDRGETERALDLWHLAVERDPSAADPWYGLAAVWLGRGLFDSALTALSRALRGDPLHWKAREARIQALTGLGRHGEAGEARAFLRDRARLIRAIRDPVTVAVLPRSGGAVVIRESLRPGPWVWRVEHFDQARGGGKPIKTMELRQSGRRYSWVEVAADGSVRETSSHEAPPDLPALLEETR